jgi:hypothetical protein
MKQVMLGNGIGWMTEEFSEIEFGDKRLKTRFLKIAEQFAKKSEAPINQACEDWADTKAAYRFFDNQKVKSENIISEHCKRTKIRADYLDTILAIQDTCYISYNNHPKTEGLCQIRGNVKGLVMHTTFGVTPVGEPIGILHQKIWSREPDLKKSRNYRLIPIEEKEPFKWIEALRESIRLLSSSQKQKKVISIADREADIFEFIDEHRKLNASFIIRAKADRSVNKETRRSKTKETLWGYLEKTKPSTLIEVEVPKKKGQPKRIAKVAVAFNKVIFQPPTNKTKDRNGVLESLKVNVVFAKEVDPPQNVEPLEWMLLTDLPVENEEDALQIVAFYKIRWSIEEYHKILKSGCTVEECRFKTAERLIRYIALMSIIAWRLYYITHVARSRGDDADCTTILAEYEWKALYLKMSSTKILPDKPPTIAQVIRWIAKLGGFLGRKNDNNPGITVIWRGWTRLTEIVDAYLLFAAPKLVGNS